MANPDVSAHSIAQVDMINATSKLQIEAAEVRGNSSNKPNWTSYLRSQLIPQEVYNFISNYENAKKKEERDDVLNRDQQNTASSVIYLIKDVAKDQIIRYVLTVFDDMLQEDKSRVDIFHNYAQKHKQTIWSYFQGILTRQDQFIVNQVSILSLALGECRVVFSDVISLC